MCCYELPGIPGRSWRSPSISPHLFQLPFACSCRLTDKRHHAAGQKTSNRGKLPFAHRRRTILATIATFPILDPLVHADAATSSNAVDMQTIQHELSKILSKARSAGMLRLAFHDAGTFDTLDKTGGMNGSIIYELDRPENAGLEKTVKILAEVKGELEKSGQVTWADLIAVAGAEAVAFCGGPKILLRLGRLDERMPDPEGKLPLESSDANSLKGCFLRKGFSTQELVALSGAHTLGNKGFGNPNVFDNSYFKILLEKPWSSSVGMSKMIGLPSDRALVNDDECLRWIEKYAANELLFFADFITAYIKLVNSGAHWNRA